MGMGQIAAIQEGSPAEFSGIRPGDILRSTTASRWAIRSNCPVGSGPWRAGR